MQKEFWLEKWNANQIGFHRDSCHPLLEAHAKDFFKGKKKVFVPLCGASVDMHFLQSLGLEVVGVELSQLAVEKFFSDAGLKPDIAEKEKFRVYRSKDFTLYCGDLFDFDLFEGIDCIYDRASIIALPSEIRERYASFINTNLRVDYFLLTIDFNNDEIGPPFSVPKNKVENYFKTKFKIELKETCPQEASVHTDKIQKLNENLFWLTPLEKIND